MGLKISNYWSNETLIRVKTKKNIAECWYYIHLLYMKNAINARGHSTGGGILYTFQYCRPPYWTQELFSIHFNVAGSCNSFFFFVVYQQKQRNRCREYCTYLLMKISFFLIRNIRKSCIFAQIICISLLLAISHSITMQISYTFYAVCQVQSARRLNMSAAAATATYTIDNRRIKFMNFLFTNK